MEVKEVEKFLRRWWEKNRENLTDNLFLKLAKAIVKKYDRQEKT